MLTSNKTCTKCKVEKAVSEFYKQKKTYHSHCKKCTRVARKKFYISNKERLKLKEKAYRQDNSKILKQYHKKKYEKNAEKIIKRNVQYKKYKRIRDPVFNFREKVRTLIGNGFKRNKTRKYRKQTKTEQLLGCTIEQLQDHLAKQFIPGMSLENHGKWHIDHVVPLASASTQAEIEALCHYTNLQPLWAEDNLKKGSKNG